MVTKNLQVAYVYLEDLNIHTQYLLEEGKMKFEEVSAHNLSLPRSSFAIPEVVIFSYKGKYKVLKSRY
jgi:hypothetical protein